MEASRFTMAGTPVAIQSRWREVVAALLVSLAAGYAVASTGDWKVAIGLGVAAVFVVVGLLAPAAFVMVFMLVRPLADGTSDAKLFAGINAAGFLALLVVAVALIALVGREAPKNQLPGFVPAGLVVLALSALAAVLALADLQRQVGVDPLAELARLASLFAVYLLGYFLFANLDRVRTLFTLVAVSAVIPALVGLYQWVQGIQPNRDLGFGRLEGTFFGPNPYATYLAAAALILIAAPRGAIPRWVRLGSLIPVIVALYGTYSRAGWAIFVIGLLLLELRQRRLMIAALGLIVVVLLVNLPGVSDRIVRSAGSGTAVPSSLGWRFDNWRQLLGKYGESPVIGYGLRTTEVVNPNRTRQLLPSRTPENPSGYAGFSPHNAAVRALIEGGPLLLAAWVALFVVLIAGMRRLAREGTRVSPYARILWALWVGMAVVGLVAMDTTNLTAVLFGLLALTGAVVGARPSGPEAEPKPA